MNDVDYLRLLGLDKSASKNDLKARYKKLCQILHPDSGGDSELFMLVKEAYESLKSYNSLENVSADNFKSDYDKPDVDSDSDSSPKKKSKRSNASYSFDEIIKGLGEIEFSFKEFSILRECGRLKKAVYYDDHNFNLVFKESEFVYEFHKNVFLNEPIIVTLYCKPSLFKTMQPIAEKEIFSKARIIERTNVFTTINLSFPKGKFGKVEILFCDIKKQFLIFPSTKVGAVNITVFDYTKALKFNDKHNIPFTSRLELYAVFKLNINHFDDSN